MVCIININRDVYSIGGINVVMVIDDMLRPALSGTILAKRLAYRSHGSDSDSKVSYNY
jgi:hypothetical protein